MKLHEYQAKNLLAKEGVAVPPGFDAESVEDAVAAAEKLGGNFSPGLTRHSHGRRHSLPEPERHSDRSEHSSPGPESYSHGPGIPC